MTEGPREDPLAPGRPVPQLAPKRGRAGADEHVADVPPSGRRPRVGDGQLDGPRRDPQLIRLRAPGDLLDRAAVAVAGREILQAIDPRRVAPEDRLDAALRVEERVPVERGEEPEADDAVADRDLIRRLPVVLAAQYLVRIGPPRLQHLVERLQGRRRFRALVAKELEQADGERVGGIGRRGAAGDSATQRSARRRSSQLRSICSESRRRFSIRTSRSMVGRAHSSPIVSGVDSWNAPTNRVMRASSSSLSVWATRARARAWTRG